MNTHLTPKGYKQRLANDEVLAVAYQYTIGDKVYQVGEFGNDGIDATIVTGNAPSGLSRKA
jgi:cell surface protein SprA